MKVIAVERLAQVGRLATENAAFSRWLGLASGYDGSEKKESAGPLHRAVPSRETG
jgi:hypothetical protein